VRRTVPLILSRSSRPRPGARSNQRQNISDKPTTSSPTNLWSRYPGLAGKLGRVTILPQSGYKKLAPAAGLTCLIETVKPLGHPLTLGSADSDSRALLSAGTIADDV
jgi:hypothetical protein